MTKAETKTLLQLLEEVPDHRVGNWCIENKLHWCLDCCFHEDDMHVTLGHAAVVINMFRKLCMQILKADTSVKDSLAGKRQRCAWSFPYALAVVKNWTFS